MNKIMINNILFAIILFTVVALICYGLYYVTDPANAIPRKCVELENMKDEYFEGVVVKKYKNEHNHNFSMLDIERDGFIYSKSILSSLDSSLFKKANIGDYIIKKRGQLKYKLKLRTNQKDTVFTIGNGCSQ